MLFSTLQFIFVFLPASWAAYVLARHVSLKFGTIVLLCASLFFYGAWRVEYLPLIGGSILFNYAVYKLYKSNTLFGGKRWTIAAGVVFNLGLLIYYKYIGFVLRDVLGINVEDNVFQVPILPLAISFFTFQQISFVIDTAEDPNDVGLLEYSTYVTFFPQLIAGPIVRHDELIPQLSTERVSYGKISAGMCMFAIGLSKKVLIADSLSGWVSEGFSGSVNNFSDAWLATLSYTFQLYFDFSGYSDMAIGLGLLFGFTLPFNFNSPYKSLSIQEFWRRWHMTLSRWLRDYLYISLGGNRHGQFRTYTNLFLTMLLGGIWHGAGWTFAVWGALHGVALMINRGWSRLNIGIPKSLAWLTTMLVVVVGWVFFRAKSSGQALDMLTEMFGVGTLVLPMSWSKSIDELLSGLGLPASGIQGVDPALPLHAWIVMAALSIVVVVAPNSNQLMESAKQKVGISSLMIYAWAGIIFALSVKRLSEVSVPSEFLYFQF